MIFSNTIQRIIERNATFADKCPLHYQETFINNIKWARNLNQVKRLGAMEYDLRDATIERIINTLNADYRQVEFVLESIEASKNMKL